MYNVNFVIILGYLSKKSLGKVYYYQCVNCEKVFLYKLKLFFYEIIYSGERFFKCVSCDKMYKRELEFVVYQWVYMGE